MLSHGYQSYQALPPPQQQSIDLNFNVDWNSRTLNFNMPLAGQPFARKQ